MRILYGVTGCGLGHTMRARVLGEHLRSRGDDVLFAASGRAVGILRGHGFRVVPIDGMFARRFDVRVLRDFLRRRFHRLEDARIRSGNADAVRALEGALS